MKYFLMLLSITFVSYAQQDPVDVLHMVVRSIELTLESLKNNNIVEAALIANNMDEELGLLNHFDYLRFDGYIYDLTNRALKAEAVRSYHDEVKRCFRNVYGYESHVMYEYIPRLWAYYFIFTNNRCKKSWCDFQKDFLNNYRRVQKKKYKAARDDYRLGYK